MSNVAKQMLSGMKWTAISTVIITVIQMVQFGMLGHIMTIQQFGLIGMMTTIMVFAQIIIDLGISAAIIQETTLSQKQLSTLYWLNVIIGCLIFVILIISSPLISDFFHQSSLSFYIRLLSIVFLIAPFGQQFQYLMQKDLQFQQIGKIDTVSNIISFGLFVASISFLSPITAYVVSQIILNGVKAISYIYAYRKKWLPQFFFDLSACKALLSFGVFQLLSRLVNRVGSNLDVILIGHFIGMEALGIYNFVYQIVTIPVLKINPIVTRVAFPVFSVHKNQLDQLREGYLRMTNILCFITFPLLIGLVVVSNLFIQLFFGSKWLEAVPLLQVMSVVGILRVLMNPSGSVILARGKANIAFYWDSCITLLYGVCLLLAVLTKQLPVVAWTYVGVSGINFVAGRYMLSKFIELSWKSYARSISFPFIYSVVIATIAYIIKYIGTQLFPNQVFTIFLLSVGLSGLVYIVLLIKKYPALLQYFPTKIRRRTE